MSEQKRTELKEAAAPLMKWMRENYHPHVTAIVTGGDEALQAFLEWADSRGHVHMREHRHSIAEHAWLACDAQYRTELAALRADAERLEWYFGPASKADWLDTFMTGVRENWTVDQWRAAIDAAIAKAGK